MQEYRNPGVMTISGKIISEQKGFDITIFDPGILNYRHYGVVESKSVARNLAKKMSRKRMTYARVIERRSGSKVAFYEKGKRMRYR